jgi:hypothetical protein
MCNVTFKHTNYTFSNKIPYLSPKGKCSHAYNAIADTISLQTHHTVAKNEEINFHGKSIHQCLTEV